MTMMKRRGSLVLPMDVSNFSTNATDAPTSTAVSPINNNLHQTVRVGGVSCECRCHRPSSNSSPSSVPPATAQLPTLTQSNNTRTTIGGRVGVRVTASAPTTTTTTPAAAAAAAASRRVAPPPTATIVAAAAAPRATKATTPTTTTTAGTPYSITNLFLRHIPVSLDDAQVRVAFAAFGPIVSTTVMRNIHTGAPLGTAFVRFERSKDASGAFRHFKKGAHTLSDTGRIEPRATASAAVVAGGMGTLPTAKKPTPATTPSALRFSVQWAKRQHDEAVVGDKRLQYRKLFLRNIPLGVTESDVMAVAVSFGEVEHITVLPDTAARNLSSASAAAAAATAAATATGSAANTSKTATAAKATDNSDGGSSSSADSQVAVTPKKNREAEEGDDVMMVTNDDDDSSSSGSNERNTINTAATAAGGEADEDSEERLIAFVSFRHDGSAAAACDGLHGTTPFPSCRAVPLLAKLAEDTRQRRARRASAAAAATAASRNSRSQRQHHQHCDSHHTSSSSVDVQQQQQQQQQLQQWQQQNGFAPNGTFTGGPPIPMPMMGPTLTGAPVYNGGGGGLGPAPGAPAVPMLMTMPMNGGYATGPAVQQQQQPYYYQQQPYQHQQQQQQMGAYYQQYPYGGPPSGPVIAPVGNRSSIIISNGFAQAEGWAPPALLPPPPPQQQQQQQQQVQFDPHHSTLSACATPTTAATTAAPTHHHHHHHHSHHHPLGASLTPLCGSRCAASVVVIRIPTLPGLSTGPSLTAAAATDLLTAPRGSSFSFNSPLEASANSTTKMSSGSIAAAPRSPSYRRNNPYAKLVVLESVPAGGGGGGGGGGRTVEAAVRSGGGGRDDDGSVPSHLPPPPPSLKAIHSDREKTRNMRGDSTLC